MKDDTLAAYSDFTKWCRDNPSLDLDSRPHSHGGPIGDGGYISDEKTRVAFAAWRAAIEADRKRRGEPVVLATYHAIVDDSEEHIMQDTRTNQLEIYDEREDAVKAAPDHLSVVPVYVAATEGPLYTTPQPAEPAQEPSDDIDIKDVREYLDAWGCLAHPGVVALLNWYDQQFTAPKGWQLVPIGLTKGMRDEFRKYLIGPAHHSPDGCYSVFLKAAPTYSATPKRLEDMSKAELIELIEDERAAQGLPPYNPRKPTEEEWGRLTETGRKAWGEPEKVVSDDEVLEAMRPSLDEGDGGYVCDMSPMHVIASGRALLARYGSKS